MPDCLLSHGSLSSKARALINRNYAPARWRRTPPLGAKQHQRLRRWLVCLDSNRRYLLVKHWREKKVALAHERHYQRTISVPGADYLRKLRNCESGTSGLYRADTGNDFYGAYQFTLSTWHSVGGRGYPDDAEPREQDMRAALLYQREGSSPWPVCG